MSANQPANNPTTVLCPKCGSPPPSVSGCMADDCPTQEIADLMCQPPVDQPAKSQTTLKLADWHDPRVQLVYRLLCSDEKPPIEEHWEGYAARRIVAELEALNV